MNRLARSIWSLVADIWSRWEQFWFQPTTPESLGVLRIVAGGMVLYTHLVWGTALQPFFGNQGWQDPQLVQTFHRESTAMSFWTYVPEPWLETIHVFCLLILLCFWLGIATRLTSILAFVIVVSYANRVPLATFGLDQINGLLTFYLAIGPSGDCFSIDRLWRRYRQANKAIKTGAKIWRPVLQPKASARLATRLIQVHLCILYTMAGLAKLKGEAWWDGNAIWMGAANFEYQSGDLTWLAWYPWIGNLITHVTVFWELTFWVFIWKPSLRPFVLAIGVLMHLGIGAFLGMWTFGLVMIFAYVSFVPPEIIVACLHRLRSAASIVVAYEVNDFVSRQETAWRCAFSLATSFELKPVESTTRNWEPVVAFTGSRGSLSPVVSVGDWWEQLRSTKSKAWRLAPTVGDQERYPQDILIVSSIVAHQTQTQQYFHERGFATRVASDVPQACVALSSRATKCVLLFGYHPEELEDIQRFRDMCIAGGKQAPITVVALYKQLWDDVGWEPKRDHCIAFFPISLRELRYEMRDAWLWRNSIDECRSQPKDGKPKPPSPALPKIANIA